MKKHREKIKFSEMIYILQLIYENIKIQIAITSSALRIGLPTMEGNIEEGKFWPA